MVKKQFKIDGMHCTSCAMLIEGELEDIGVACSCSYAKQTLEVEYDPDKHTDANIKAAVKKAGYVIKETRDKKQDTRYKNQDEC